MSRHNNNSRFSKKASISLSINAIVVVVLAFIMLGLGLALTRGIFSSIGDTQGQVSEQVRQQILDDLRTGNKPLSFPSNDIKVQFKGQADVVIGIKNTGDGDRQYCLQWEAFTDSGEAVPLTEMDFVYIDDVRTLQGGSSEVIPIKLRAKTSGQGLYKGNLIVHENMAYTGECALPYNSVDGWKRHASKSFFITVN